MILSEKAFICTKCDNSLLKVEIYQEDITAMCLYGLNNMASIYKTKTVRCKKKFINSQYISLQYNSNDACIR